MSETIQKWYTFSGRKTKRKFLVEKLKEITDTSPPPTFFFQNSLEGVGVSVALPLDDVINISTILLLPHT